MKKRNIIGLIILMLLSALYDFSLPEELPEETKSYSVVYLEGAFKQNGEYRFEGEMTVNDLVNQVGVQSNANLNCLNPDKEVEDESRLYLPVKIDHPISLNQASQEELMSLTGIGEKKSLLMIDYRENYGFSCLEDLMNISGIGEKTYLKLRDYLCL